MLNLFKKVRVVNWVFVFLCFFLPFVRGCDNQVEYPYQIQIDSIEGFLIRILPFIYPLILLGAWFLLTRLKGERPKDLLVTSVYSAFFILLTYFFIKSIIEVTIHPKVYNTDEILYFCCLILFWGLFAMSFSRRRLDATRKLELLGVNFSVYAFIALPILFLFNKGWLIGAWIYFLAHAIILASFISEVVLNGPTHSNSKKG